MDTKFVVFVLIATVLVAAIYSSTIHIAFAKWNCNIRVAVKGDKICTDRDDTTGQIIHVIYCKKGVSQCILVYGTRIGEAISPDLQNAINDILQGPGNNTKVPNTDILKDNTTLQQNNDDGKQPKAPKVPEDLGGLNNNNSG